MKKQRTIIAAILISSLMIFGGCNDKEVEGRKVIKNENKTITVIKDTKEVLGDEVVVSKIDRYEGLIGWDWFEDEKVMVSKADTTQFNLLSYELQSKKETAIPYDSLSVYPFNSLSPDKKHIFNIKEYSKTISITDIEAITKIEVEISLGLNLSLAKWVNNEEIIIPYIYGEGFYVVNIDGTKSEIIATNDSEYTKEIYKFLGKVDNKVYYISVDNEYTMSLVMYDLEIRDRILLVGHEDIENCKLSPDKKKLILHKLNKRDKEHEIILMNLDGTERESLMISPHTIFRYELSTDGTKLAYWYRENTNNIDIIEVIDLRTNKKSQIFSGEIGYKQYTFENILKWSPSGEKIMLNTMKTNMEELDYYINVITLK